MTEPEVAGTLERAALCRCGRPRFDDKQAADTAALRRSREHGGVRVYECPSGGWHLARPRGS